MNAATQGKPRRLYPMLGWTLLEYTFRSTPYCIMLGVVWELIKLPDSIRFRTGRCRYAAYGSGC